MNSDLFSTREVPVFAILVCIALYVVLYLAVMLQSGRLRRAKEANIRLAAKAEAMAQLLDQTNGHLVEQRLRNFSGEKQ